MSLGQQTASAYNLVACHSCGLVNRCPSRGARVRCARCQAPLTRRIQRSVSRSWAFLVAAIVLYLPANLLPVMATTYVGNTQADTIMSGVIYLLHHDWPLALIVFVASILIPVVKIGILAYLLVSVQMHSAARPRDRLRLYRFTEFVGRWSMVDVFVVTILVALVKLGALANIDAGLGAVYFALVVIITIFAAESFDPRLIWDPEEEDHDARH